MAEILVIAETRRGTLREVSLELIGAAAQLVSAAGGGRVSAVVVDADPSRHVPTLSVAGVDRVVTITTEHEHFEAHATAELVGQLVDAERPDVVLAAHSIDAMAFAPALAARRGAGFASDVSALAWDDGVVVRRAAYGGKLVAELALGGDRTAVVMVRPGTFAAPEAGSSGAEVTAFEAQPVAPRVRHREFRDPDTGGVDITKAPFLLAVGRGIEDEDNLPRFETLADRLGATLSVSRPLVDAGWAPSALQVGQSGKTVKPKVYLAFGISGAVQHLAGMRDAGTIIAVNSDPAAPIFAVADYGAVADLFDVAEALERRLDG